MGAKLGDILEVNDYKKEHVLLMHYSTLITLLCQLLIL